MSTTPLVTASPTDQPLPPSLANLIFDHPGADIILRSQDSSLFRVPKIYIVNSSPILGDLIRRTLDSPSNANADASLPVVQLPESGEILHCLFTFIFSVTPLLPSTPEDIMELLFVAQKYQMGTALTHIRGSIAQQNSLPTRIGPALHIYALAQKYGLRPEALRTARAILLKHSMTIEDFDNKLDIMPGVSLHELWKYHERVRVILESDLTEFMASCARGTITGLCCTELSSSQIPSWLDQYIQSIGKTPNLFDPAELNIAMVRHTKVKANENNCKCGSISSQTIRDFWEALTSVVYGSFEKAESALSLVRDQEDPQAQINWTTFPPVTFDVSDTNLIIRSSDLVDFRVHKSVLAIASPFFKDLLSLPQPSDSESVDGLPVVQLPESSELLNSLISILYPIRTEMPTSYEKVLYLLAACQKYEMASVQSSIRAAVILGASPMPKGDEAFRAYAIASAKDIIPEMENAARLTLDHPMTFELLGEGLRLFEGWALRDLVNFRMRCRDNLVTCLDPFTKPLGPSSIWVGCPEVMPAKTSRQNRVLPKWLSQLLSRNHNDLKHQNFTHPLDIHSRIRREYVTALQNHGNCTFCMGVHIKNGSTFCAELENKLARVRDKVRGDRGSPSGSTYISLRNR
ncbi:hypothetical protein DFH94DRAFT_696019 [Russula ochroleuca]|uniref:BTB domain-containing protein n=1 Tax=Russula ochroleuca TaxID=152965 RepID=A0A9P5JZH8_9AGAM|nr:hypothetical protein DFH94DRAFT_696019 [Russula ochroleuca]